MMWQQGPPPHRHSRLRFTLASMDCGFWSTGSLRATSLPHAMAQLEDARGGVLAAGLAPLTGSGTPTGAPAAAFSTAVGQCSSAGPSLHSEVRELQSQARSGR